MKDCIGTLSKLHSIGNMLTLHVRYFYIRDGFLGPFTEVLILPSIEHCYLPMLWAFAELNAEPKTILSKCAQYFCLENNIFSLSLFTLSCREVFCRESITVSKNYLNLKRKTKFVFISFAVKSK